MRYYVAKPQLCLPCSACAGLAERMRSSQATHGCLAIFKAFGLDSLHGPVIIWPCILICLLAAEARAKTQCTTLPPCSYLAQTGSFQGRDSTEHQPPSLFLPPCPQKLKAKTQYLLERNEARDRKQQGGRADAPGCAEWSVNWWQHCGCPPAAQAGACICAHFSLETLLAHGCLGVASLQPAALCPAAEPPSAALYPAAESPSAALCARPCTATQSAGGRRRAGSSSTGRVSSFLMQLSWRSIACSLQLCMVRGTAPGDACLAAVAFAC